MSFRSELETLLRLATPVVIGQVGMMLMGVVDTVMVGHLGEEALGGVALGYSWSFAVLTYGIGITVGFDPLLAQAFGANDLGSTMLEENVVRAAGVTFRLSAQELATLIRRAGFIPARRDTYYEQLEMWR